MRRLFVLLHGLVLMTTTAMFLHAAPRAPVRPLTIEVLQDRQMQKDVAGCRCSLDEVAEALKRIDAQLAKDPENLRNRIRRGRFLAMGGCYIEAISDFNEVLARRPFHPEARQSRGAVLFMLGEYDRALLDFAEALATRSDDARLKSYIMMCRRAMKEEGFVAHHGFDRYGDFPIWPCPPRPR